MCIPRKTHGRRLAIVGAAGGYLGMTYAGNAFWRYALNNRKGGTSQATLHSQDLMMTKLFNLYT